MEMDTGINVPQYFSLIFVGPHSQRPYELHTYYMILLKYYSLHDPQVTDRCLLSLQPLVLTTMICFL